jgi:signal transduction histidine kinase
VRRRIVLVSGATTVLVLVAFLAPLLSLVRQVARTQAMAAGRADAQTVVTLLLTVQSPGDVRLGVGSVNAASPMHTTVLYPDGTLLGAGTDSDPLVTRARQQRRSFDVVDASGGAVYQAVDLGRGPCCVVVRTRVPVEQLQAGVAQASLVLVALAAALLLTALLVAQLLARSLVRPLLGVADVAHRLHDGDLSRRADLSGPGEISAIGASLNSLATRIDELLQAERETLADLSHRLRTPLTALRMDAESLADPEDSQRLSGDIDEVERSLDAVIEQARRPVTQALGTGCDLGETTRTRLDFWGVLAREQGRRMTVKPAARPIPVPLRRDQVEAVVDALVGNVFTHTPAGTSFSVSVSPGPPPSLVVLDAGPGLGEDSLLLRGRSGSGSTGLGLDIARRAGESCGGGLTTTPGPDGTGLRAEVRFGP